MLARRQFLGFTSFGSLVGPMPEQLSERSMQDVVDALHKLRDELAAARAPVDAAIAPVREQFKIYLRVNGKFPDFIDVGMDVWHAIYDWHVRWQQPITISRDSGRYTVRLMETTAVLRADQAANFIGVPYDNK